MHITVEPVYSRHLRFLEKVSAIEVFNISRRKGKKDTLMHNNALNLINTVTGKRVTRGAGLGLEVPMDYTFYGDARVVLWLEKTIKKITENIDAKVAKCLE